uniref:Uncharacterized protein n=1 Tax=Sciurus vulgaris TaxID=55149 RepID=A0A8D2DUK1_SCIVU
MYYQRSVFKCDYYIKTNLDIQKHMKFSTFNPDHLKKTSTVILDLLNTNFKCKQAVISGMVAVYNVVCFFITADGASFPVFFENTG